MSKRKISLLLLWMSVMLLGAQSVIPEYSSAGFFEIENSGRKAYNFNVGWRFVKKDVEGAEKVDFNDSEWEKVNLPHGLEIVPWAASGSSNYQGQAWYRKHITFGKEFVGKKLSLYFEAIMGKSKIYVNGRLVKEQFGGFLPIVIDITTFVTIGEESVIAVWADNSDDPEFPPGKAQTVMDFAYFGGIYRDCWLVATNLVHVSDPNFVDKVAGGGIFVHYENLSPQNVDVVVETDIVNEYQKSHQLQLNTEIKDKSGRVVGKASSNVKLKGNTSLSVKQTIRIHKPQLWEPDSPYLHNLITSIRDKQGNALDGFRKRIGIRKVEFRGKQGLYLNGKKFEGKLMGGNRHQDFAYLGNALPNNTHYRDAKKLRDAGMRIIRSAHYPQDPAFMDACDELGLFVIVATPGWQFWPTNNVELFENRVYSDIRQMVRLYRNNPSVIMWEPILNETHYPLSFAKNVHDEVHREFPYQGAFTACDKKANGSEYFDLMYGTAAEGESEDKSYFIREWGDNVDDWSSHNSPSRAAREWGEKAQLVQALHYSYPIWYKYYNFDRLYRYREQNVGGTLWHSFDHQRGYHPDPFYGGIMDAIRQPKYSYQFFKSQRPAGVNLENAESGPMVYIAHEMTPFSEPDVLVFSNCEQVRLIVYEADTLLMDADHDTYKMPHPYFYFKDVFKFMTIKELHRNKEFEKASLYAEGLINGKVVASDKRMPAKKTTQIILSVDNENMSLIADGSDVVPVIASICDKDGIVKRLNNEYIQFEIQGEGVIVGNGLQCINPIKVEWGTAPILVRSTNTAGKILIKARLLHEGKTKALGGELMLESVVGQDSYLFNEIPDKENTVSGKGRFSGNAQQEKHIKESERQFIEKRLKEVEEQQSEFDTSK